MAVEEINKCTAYSAILFGYLAWLSGVLAAALPYWITTKGHTFEYMNLGFWEYCKQIDLVRTGCHSLTDGTIEVKREFYVLYYFYIA